MPYNFEIDLLNGILLGRFEGQVTDEELRAYCRDSTEYIGSIEPRAGITDLSAMTSFEVSQQTIIELARVRPAIPGQDPVRIITAESPFVFGMARMFELAGQDAHPVVHVVHTDQEAWAILSVTKPQFKPYKAESGKASA